MLTKPDHSTDLKERRKKKKGEKRGLEGQVEYFVFLNLSM